VCPDRIPAINEIKKAYAKTVGFGLTSNTIAPNSTGIASLNALTPAFSRFECASVRWGDSENPKIVIRDNENERELRVACARSHQS
jgi:hypothetical protein